MKSHILVRILRRLKLLKFLSINQTIKINDTRFVVPLVEGLNESLLHLKSSFKTDILNQVNQHLDVKQFVDIGANYGQTLLEVYSIFPEIKYFAFEPNPIAFELLTRLTSTNKLSPDIFPCACSDQNGLIKIYKTDNPVDSGATILPGIRPDFYVNNPGSWIASYSLDSLSSIINFTKNFILKIDVEGSEFKVLQSGAQVISQFRPIILCEVLHSHSEETLELSLLNKKAIQEFLEKQSYKIYLCIKFKESGRLEKLTELEEIPISIYKLSPDTCDYVFVPIEISLSANNNSLC